MSPTAFRTETLRRFSEWNLVANETLPLVESDAEIQPKDPAQVAARAVAASYVASICFGARPEIVRPHLDRYALWNHLTKAEQALFSPEGLAADAKAYHSWLIESIQFMAWALCLTQLDHFTHCDDRLADLIPRSQDPSDFIRTARLRPLDELRQEGDTLYMLHWRAVESNLTGEQNDLVVLPRVSFRRHAADWIVGTADEWEDVALDT